MWVECGTTKDRAKLGSQLFSAQSLPAATSRLPFEHCTGLLQLGIHVQPLHPARYLHSTTTSGAAHVTLQRVTAILFTSCRCTLVCLAVGRLSFDLASASQPVGSICQYHRRCAPYPPGSVRHESAHLRCSWHHYYHHTSCSFHTGLHPSSLSYIRSTVHTRLRHSQLPYIQLRLQFVLHLSQRSASRLQSA